MPSPPNDAADPGKSRQKWHGRTLGGAWLFATCAWLLRFVGIPGSWVGSYIIAAGFVLCGGREQYGALRYWRRVRPRAGALVHWMLCYRQFASFGRVLCDRQLVWLRDNAFHYSHLGGDRLRRAVQSPEGCILLAAHVGNWELSGFRLQRIARGTIHLVMIREDLPYVQRMVDARMRAGDTAVIDPRDPLGASLAIAAALGKGETVCMLGDRAIAGQPTATARFFGVPARFPTGPFHAAAITGAPILVCFLVKVAAREYRLEVDEPWYIRLPARGPARAAALAEVAQRWAERLEFQVKRFPLQWHNFFDFWE